MKVLNLEHILTQNGFGFAYLSADLAVLSCNPLFRNFAARQGEVLAQPLPLLFPETFGLETVFEEIAAGTRPFFKLETLQRDLPDADECYIDIAVYPTSRAEAPLFCLIQNVTPKAQLTQQVYQQQNEIRLLESIVRAHQAHAALNIWGTSEPIRQIRQTIAKISRIPTATILLKGESGTGKSMVARIIHHAAMGKTAPFVEINCAAIPDTLLESELFGYEKGAFTNAVSSKTGLLEAADGGTLFLDEIGEMPHKLQAKLLSFLETRRFRRLGSTREQEVKIRLITATNRDLNLMVREGEFREDLFYRLNVVNIELPPLRQLGDDVLLIAGNLIQSFNINFQKRVQGFTPAARQKLRNHRWPGNVRELRNAIERAMIFVESDMIDAADLQLGSLQAQEPSASPLERFQLPPEGLSFDDIERKLLEEALALAEGNQSQAAKLLHLSRDTFRYRLEKFNLL
ncbi:MAG: sigma 54-interacting transcriptional regulator [Calditrichaeota bacterium]|nr:sigma 54-interacting transcriptional regulator [Calditrichota bacterium]MCB9086949.1 sigma 54-interacting transcriptional regulator [Calditrichia bacterium]MCB0291225.1 sigma 54-interacting transcriptional regulator [Calditrichota bacterium]MCB0295871.1 sigma 54-interacting transcriptional regulator [Calditrichota bacterium]MCB0303508.1 sigma 54-interacting transcriptional regulator [Calditrichota bacterium]